LLDDTFGLRVSRVGYSGVVHVDETGWRIGTLAGWY
jgi:hypothetical protein